MDKLKKIEANELGKFAEDIAADEYIKEGYAILERNWRLGKIEIDLIARKENIIVFIEVKARKGDYMKAEEAMTSDKMRRMIRAADSYLRQQIGDCIYRFDLVAFNGTKTEYKLEILKDAFISADLF